jgi:hypothetical protein
MVVRAEYTRTTVARSFIDALNMHGFDTALRSPEHVVE